MKVFLPAKFCWVATISLYAKIGMGMVVIFFYILEKTYHPNLYQ